MDKFNSLRIILDYVSIYNIVLGKHIQKMRKKKTKPVHWSTQGVDFIASYIIKVENLLPKLDATIIVTWNLHVYNSQGKHRYYVILGSDILYELKKKSFSHKNKIMLNGGAYKIYTDQMKEVPKSNLTRHTIGLTKRYH